MATSRFVVPRPSARALKAAIRGEDAETTVREDVGFELLADLIEMVRDFHGAYLKVPK